MKRLLHAVLLLMLSVTLWAGNAAEEKEEDWLMLEDSHAYYERVDASVDRLEPSDLVHLRHYQEFKDGVVEFNEQVVLLNDQGEVIKEMEAAVYNSFFKLAQKYVSLRNTSPQAARIAGSFLAATEMGTQSTIFGFAYDAFVFAAESDWGTQNPQKAQLLKRVAELIRVDFESFK